MPTLEESLYQALLNAMTQASTVTLTYDPVVTTAADGMNVSADIPGVNIKVEMAMVPLGITLTLAKQLNAMKKTSEGLLKEDRLAPTLGTSPARHP